MVVQQLTLDVEQYLDEVVRHAADWGHRYLACTDYDLQIIDVLTLSLLLSLLAQCSVQFNTLLNARLRGCSPSVKGIFSSHIKIVLITQQEGLVASQYILQYECPKVSTWCSFGILAVIKTGHVNKGQEIIDAMD